MTSWTSWLSLYRTNIQEENKEKEEFEGTFPEGEGEGEGEGEQGDGGENVEQTTEENNGGTTTTTTPSAPSALQLNAKGEWVSFSDLHGPWETKKITLLGTVWSFVSQLKIGQDLTRVSLPAMFLRPYSMLEVFGRRNTNGRTYLFEASKASDPYQRMLHVVRWYLTNVRQEVEQFEKKPYNPVHGEMHTCWIQEPTENILTSFIGEQVSHHPPITAIHVNNPEHNVSVFANYTFNVKFQVNALTIKTDGHLCVDLYNLKERYVCQPKALPDMIVKKLIWGGRKQIEWMGEVSLVCKETGLRADLNFDQRGETNIFEGCIKDVASGKNLCKFEGECGKATFIKAKKSKKTEKELLINVSELDSVPLYYLPRDQHDPMSSMIIWEPVNLAIVEDDMYRADVEKKKVEDLQRQLRRDNLLPQPRFFAFDEETKLYLPVYKTPNSADHPPTIPGSKFTLPKSAPATTTTTTTTTTVSTTTNVTTTAENEEKPKGE